MIPSDDNCFSRSLTELEYSQPTRPNGSQNGLDLQHLTYASPIDRPAHIVAVGHLVNEEGFMDLIDACAVLARRGSRFRCKIIGAGPLEADLRARIERLGLKKQVKLLGPQPKREIIRHIQSAAVFVAPRVAAADCDHHSLPMTLLEAMALGTPCVSTNVTGIHKVLHDYETGLVVPQHDPVALAAALERLLDDSKLPVRLAVQARRLIVGELNTHHMLLASANSFTGGDVGLAAHG